MSPHTLSKPLSPPSGSPAETSPPSKSPSYSCDPFSCCCPHDVEYHALARCGHPNDRPPSHPLHSADDALHRVWCSQCKKWCFSERDDCPILKNPKLKLGFETSHGIVDGDKVHGARAKKTSARM